MFRRISLIILILCRYTFAVEVSIPEGWSEVEVPSELPETIQSVVKLLSPQQNSEVMVSEVDIVMSMDEAEASHIRGASKGGYKHISTTEVTKLGFTGKKITGEFKTESSNEVIKAETLILLTSDSMIMIGVTGANTKALLSEVLTWIKFSEESPDVSSSEVNVEATLKSGRSFFEYIGMGIVLVAIGYAIFGNKLKSKST